MRILLTGAAGFVGGAVGEAGAAAGHEMVLVDALIPQAHPVDATAAANVHRLDVRDAADGATWAELLRGVDVVCHQAAMVGAGVTSADMPLYAGHNDLGTAALLAGMSAAGVRRLVLASSMVVYGEGRYRCPDHDLQRPAARAVADLEAGRFECPCPTCGRDLEWALVPEDADLDPRSSYAASKLAQEHFARAWARQAGGSVIALRYHNVYGPHMPQDTPYSGVAAIFRSQVEAGTAPQVFEDGGQMRDFVHVSDVAAANLLAVEAVAADAPGDVRAFNVCSGTPVSIADVAGLVARGTGADLSPVVTGGYRPGDVRHVVASPERAAAELGFRAAVRPDAGLVEFASAPLRQTRPVTSR
ncbi:NAD-dependent epimerase/dehydratase family protein [Nocardioides iriomotensis]|uniref:NAD-dependent epimerase/dehydratase family protein n=1 Tax=Nocardioides iriomotensis TaxID=715784 RepID=A0A4Q5J741_9ACTN|nr:NAD-dependent epimerase/dehydratase family protein [Nocardioides iriomotensis]RYU14333.1 NAD-dependent epimerase/dehydratase family protein [Nocardioides iriomotensis]